MTRMLVIIEAVTVLEDADSKKQFEVWFQDQKPQVLATWTLAWHHNSFYLEAHGTFKVPLTGLITLLMIGVTCI